MKLPRFLALSPEVRFFFLQKAYHTFQVDNNKIYFIFNYFWIAALLAFKTAFVSY